MKKERQEREKEVSRKEGEGEKSEAARWVSLPPSPLLLTEERGDLREESAAKEAAAPFRTAVASCRCLRQRRGDRAGRRESEI